MTIEEAFIKACADAGYDKDEVDIEDVFVGEFEYEKDFADYVFCQFCELHDISDKISWYLDEAAILRDYELESSIVKIDNYYFDFSRA